MNTETFSERIRKFRKSRGLTQSELAERLDISEMTVRRWEAGQRSPRIEETKKIAQVLSIPMHDLLPDNSGVNDLPVIPKPMQTEKSPFKNTGTNLVYERNGERLELPPTEESYKIFREIAMKIADRVSASAATV